MTVADLITELQRLPQHLPVRVLMSEFDVPLDEGEMIFVFPEEADAQNVYGVHQAGGFVLIEGG